MKNRILTFVIGILTGAIIMVLIFLVFNKLNDGANSESVPFNENGQMQRPDGNMYEVPEKPTGDMGMSPR